MPRSKGVHFGEGHIARANQKWHKVEPNTLHNGHRKKKHHGGAVRAEELIILFGIQKVVLGKHQLDAHQQSGSPGQEKEDKTGNNIAPANLFVVNGCKPASQACRCLP